MADQNVIAITGRIGQDPELRYTADGSAVLSFSVANGVYKKGAGDYNQLTTWYRCTVFGARAETINNLIRKGSRVGVTGQHSMRSWTDKEGNERLSCEINYCEVTLLDSKGSNDTDSAATAPQQPAQRATAATSKPAARNVPQQATPDEDLPF
jgi:single-strand DNA-binding protein